MPRPVLVVAYEFPPFPGGQATYASEIARAIRERGEPVVVCAPDYGEPGLEPPESHPGILVSRPLRHQALRPGDPARVAALVARVRPRAILAADVRAAMAVTPPARLLRVPVVAMFHGSDLHKLSGDAPGARLARMVLRAASARVANSEFSAGLARAVLGRSCAGAPLGVERFWLQPAARRFDHPGLAALGAGPLVCTVGRLEPRKGQLDALAVARRARELGARFRYVIAGRVVDEGYAARVRAVLGADDAYIGELSREDLRTLYSRSLCLLSPALALEDRVEGFGLTTLEAAGQGAPSVVTWVGGLPEAVVDGVSGFVLPQGDIEAMARRVADLALDPLLRSRMRQGALAHAEASGWARTLARTPLIGAAPA